MTQPRTVKLSEAQAEWLDANLDERGEVTFFENHQPYINEFCELELLKAVSGKFRCKPGVFTLYSVYALTPAGRTALGE